ncbi:phosphoglycerate kinase [Sphingopyxis indica]|uniref:Uncharacterized protein n=1 Tax=Sphingopyxis indica TaxID=436663 RepID=A0A239JQ96_9SPHN|nr:phosphoglycerate kinase [Sphingopyxis indica]MCA0211023.1 phosphoglycerate kinase [Pseudomonadota bacterium]SNT08000.1 hypothetical protein SAMN06295955_11119 [Sphingopyxis indica]
MGLDMYAMVTTTLPDSPVDFKVADATELHYWRKHPNLHGWMETLYFEKGGAQEFNCVPVELTADDLNRLEADIRAGNLPQTSGFFFGSSDGTEIADDLAFVAKAREAIAQGKTVYYDSWW